MSSAWVRPAAPSGHSASARDDFDLPDRRRARNAQILTAVLERSKAFVVRQARKHAQLPDDAEEALQSASAIFIEKYHPPAEPLPWLLTTVKREAWRIAKRAWRRRELSITAVPRSDGRGTVDLSDGFLDHDSDPALRAEEHELHADRQGALTELKPDERTALILIGLGYSYAEIGQLRDWSYTKVNRCASEARAALRDRLGSHENT